MLRAHETSILGVWQLRYVDGSTQYNRYSSTADEEQRRNGWQAEWDDTRKEPYYFNKYYDDDDDYQGSTGTESRLEWVDIVYEPYDVNSLPNYDRYRDGPFPSNNSIAAEARAKAVA